jgi:acetate---CoA ligase (ADP-forming)
VGQKKPILALKLGQTAAGARAALSHTASVAGAYEIARGVFRQGMILTCRGLDELIDVAAGLACLPKRAVKRIALIGGGGGHATSACDEISQVGLEIANLSAQTRERLGKLLPWWANINNPVEFAGGADQNPLVFSDAVETCLSDPGVDAALVFGLFGGYRIDQFPHFERRYEEAAASIVDSLRKHAKPVVLHSIYANRSLRSISLLRLGGVTVTASLSTAARVLQAVATYTNSEANRQPVRSYKPVTNSSEKGALRRLDEHEARGLLNTFGIACVRTELARTAAEATRIAFEMDGPVVLRVASADVMHKRVVGGVAVGVQTATQIERKFNEIIASVAERDPDAKIDGIWVSPVLCTDVEFAIGALRDRAFGDVVMCALGGPLIEQLDRRSFGMAPLSLADAMQMIEDAQLEPAAAVVLGTGSVQFLRELAQVAVNLGRMMVEKPLVVEVDLNPVLPDGTRAVVADPRVLIASTP